MLDIIIMVGMTVSIVVVVGEPFVRRPRLSPADDPSASVRAGLLLQKDTLYTAIRDLACDFQTGKVDQQDYVALRQQLESEAVQVLRLLDTSDAGAALEAALEQDIARLRQRPTEGALVSPSARARAVHNRV